MKLTISGVDVKTDSVTFSEKSFGKIKGVLEKYELIVDAESFVHRFGPIYCECMVELARDDAITGGFQPPYKGAIRYPTLDEFFLLSDSQRMEIVDAYFYGDILRLYFRENDVSASWWVNSLERILRVGENIYIQGAVLSG